MFDGNLVSVSSCMRDPYVGYRIEDGKYIDIQKLSKLPKFNFYYKRSVPVFVLSLELLPTNSVLITDVIKRFPPIDENQEIKKVEINPIELNIYSWAGKTLKDVFSHWCDYHLIRETQGNQEKESYLKKDLTDRIEIRLGNHFDLSTLKIGVPEPCLGSNMSEPFKNLLKFVDS